MTRRKRKPKRKSVMEMLLSIINDIHGDISVSAPYIHNYLSGFPIAFIPDADINQSITGEGRMGGWTAMHFAAKMDDAEAVRALFAMGGNPSIYSGGVTPVGLAAYTGAASALAAFRDVGADLFLLIREGQTHDPAAIGGTLLHRVLQRSFTGKTEIATLLTRHYLDGMAPPQMPTDAAGESPFSSAIDDEALAACVEIFASHEAKAISSQTMEPDPNSKHVRTI